MIFKSALMCLAMTIYHEARGEPYRGQVEVAQVVMNRVASPRFPDTVCGVVYQPHQFSWVDTVKQPEPTNEDAWGKSLSIADAVLIAPDDILPGNKALFYHETRIRPRWDRGMRLIARIGHHRFYAEKKK